MTFKFNNTFIDDVATVVGPYEEKGKLKGKFDKVYDDLYIGEKTWEKAEVKLQEESIEILLHKIKKDKKDIDLLISGDLLNQITASTYAAKKFNIPHIGIYSACASSVEGIIVGATLVDDNRIKNCIVATSSHNMTSEKQFRNPTEYGAPKPMSATFTATGGASVAISRNGKIKVESGTIGTITDMGQNDPLNMGAAMAYAAGDTIHKHLSDLKRNSNYYDLILTGDLGTYGKEILKDYISSEYGIDISNNYDDCGTLLYDLDKQTECLAGASGPACCPLVTYSKIVPNLIKKEIKKVLIVATGALFCPTFIFQKENILGIAHAVSLEVE